MATYNRKLHFSPLVLIKVVPTLELFCLTLSKMVLPLLVVSKMERPTSWPAPDVGDEADDRDEADGAEYAAQEGRGG